MQIFKHAPHSPQQPTDDLTERDAIATSNNPVPKQTRTAAPAPPMLPDDVSGRGIKLRRFRDKEHLKFVSQQACTICGRQPCEPHHIRFAQLRAITRKVSDEFTVPLCRVHHREIHRRGDEAAWWAGFGIDPMPIALRLWQQTRGVIAGPAENPSQGADVDAEEKASPIPSDASGDAASSTNASS